MKFESGESAAPPKPRRINKRNLFRFVHELAESHWRHNVGTQCTEGWARCQCNFAKKLRELETFIKNGT